ncbi:MAG: hypothetical protein ACYTFI_09555, partial [Planctomycetota bacterium]
DRPASDDSPAWPAGASAGARLVFQHLLHEKYAEATTLYERLRESQRGFALADHLEQRDYLDCLFLLGEAYEKQSRTGQALRFYEEVYELESKHPTRPFLDVLRARIRALRGA